jgi:hypothetical protein
MGTTQEGFDGSVAWTADPMRGTQIKEGKELNQARHDADLHADLNYADYYKTFETVELTEFRDQPAYKVRLVNNDDVESFQFYSPETGLKLGEQQTVPTQMGPIHVTGIINAYADHGDIKVPAAVTNDMGHMQQQITIESVSFEPIEESVFALPPAVQALLAPPAEEEEPETPAEDEPETPAEDEPEAPADEPGTPADPEPDGE